MELVSTGQLLSNPLSRSHHPFMGLQTPGFERQSVDEVSLVFLLRGVSKTQDRHCWHFLGVSQSRSGLFAPTKGQRALSKGRGKEEVPFDELRCNPTMRRFVFLLVSGFKPFGDRPAAFG